MNEKDVDIKKGSEDGKVKELTGIACKILAEKINKDKDQLNPVLDGEGDLIHLCQERVHRTVLKIQP